MNGIYKIGDSVMLYNGDCIEVMKTLPDDSVDSIVTDPPYELGFMGKKWDNTGIANSVDMWKECYRVLKPGGHVLSFGGTRTYHRMACAIEDAGFEIRDQMQWLYGCLSEDTEILTSEGWKSKDGIRVGDTIFSMNLSNSNAIPNRVRHVFEYNHSGNMVHLLNDNTDQLLTPNHKVICQEGRRVQTNKVREVVWGKQFKYKDAGLIDGEHYKLPLAGRFDGDFSIGKDFAELVGWILAEGYFHKDTNAISIYQSSVNKQYVTRIMYVLGRCGINYSHYEREREYSGRKYILHQFYLSGKIVDKIKLLIPNKLPTKKLWYLPLREKQRLFYGLCAGDGSLGHGEEFSTFYQKNKDTLEWFQVLLHFMGKQGRINESKWAVSIHHNATTEIQGKHYPNRTVQYDGKVWCIETDVGNFFARRNGKIFVTGNSGFPKSMNIGKAIDKVLGAEREVVGKRTHPTLKDKSKVNRQEATQYHASNPIKDEWEITLPATDSAKQWSGWGTCLKPANEPICLARKPISEKTVAENVLKWGTGGMNIDACRISTSETITNHSRSAEAAVSKGKYGSSKEQDTHQTDGQKTGRFPANIILDEEAGKILDAQSGVSTSTGGRANNALRSNQRIYGKGVDKTELRNPGLGDTGGASRFFYCPKTSKSERNAGLGLQNHHPTVKPVKLMEYLIKLVTPPNGVVLDPFTGSGSTGVAARNLGFRFVGIEKEKEYCEIAEKRISHVQGEKQLSILGDAI